MEPPKDETAQNARQRNLRECAKFGVAKNENDRCGIQNLIDKKTKSYLLMSAIPPVLHTQTNTATHKHTE